MSNTGRINDLQFMPFEEDRHEMVNNTKNNDLEDIITNPVIFASIVSAGTGKKYEPVAWGKYGSKYIKSVLNNGMTLSGIDYNPL